MLARATNWTKRTLVVTMMALMAVGYVGCSDDGGADSSLNSSINIINESNPNYGHC